MRRNPVLPTLLSFAALCLFCLAAIPEVKARWIVSGEEAQKNYDKLKSEIKWHTSLVQALNEAEKSGKLVFWVQMLGAMDGHT